MARKISKDKRKPVGGEKTRYRVVRFLSKNPTSSFNPKQISKKLELRGNYNIRVIFGVLLELENQGNVLQVSPEQFMIAPKDAQDVVTGVFDHVSPSFGFVIVEGRDDDIKISRNNTGSAMDGDVVHVGILGDSRGKKVEGNILEIIKRKRTEVVGTVDRASKHTFVIPDSKKLHQDIYINPKRNKKGISDGDKVLVEITSYPSEDRKPEGIITRVLGEAGTHKAEMNSIILEYDLPEEFPTNVIEEAENISTNISQTEIKKRRDVRDVPTFTIDPFDAKDFDDAISLKELENGVYEIGIHIADVSHYVKPNSALDKEGYKRATSVYLVDRVIPMLPEKLSNGLCSLRPNEDKLCFSSIFQLSAEGKLIKEWFGRTVIHSDRRFTYEEAQERLESKDGDYAEELNILNDMAYKLRAKRFKEGSISFETTEVKFKLDENGTPIEVVPKVRQDAHKLVEDFMLLANKQVANYVFKQKEDKQPKTFVYRVHESPNFDKLNTFSAFAKRFGYTMEFNEGNVSETLNKLGQDSEGKPEENMLQSLAIRTMAKAKYTTEPLGHFGLGFDHYSHFTSPIRRYPDVMVHRLLQHYLDGGSSFLPEEIEEKCEHASEQEKIASTAERDSIKYKQVEFMSLKERGIEYQGIVTGVTDFGLFVEITETKCEGMVRLSDIDDDHYEYDEDNYRISGRNNGRVITFGDTVTVKVKHTDLRNRTMDLTFVF